MENELLLSKTDIETSGEQIQEMKNFLEEQHGREFTWEESRKSVWDLQTLAGITIEMATEEFRRQKLLKESPKGFYFDRTGYCCQICGGSASEANSWYDKYGLKCMTCQKAINQKIIPGSISKNKESWYSKYELESYFNIKGAFLTKCVKSGFFKDRIIPGIEKKVHLQLLLIKDNKDVLPPKKLFHSKTVKVERNGEEYFTSEHWYEWIDKALAKKLAKYKTIECLKESFAMPMKSGRFYYKEINPLFTYKY